MKQTTMEEIEALRITTKTNQLELIDLLGISGPTYRSWKNGEVSPRLDQANKMIAYLNDKAALLKKHHG